MRGMFFRPKDNRLILLLLVVLPIFNTITSNMNTTTVTIFTTMHKGIQFNLLKKNTQKKTHNTNNNKDPRSELVKDHNNKKLKMKKREKKEKRKHG